MNTRTVRVPKARLLAAAFAVVAGSSALFAGTAVAAEAPDSLRVAGENRYETAVEIAHANNSDVDGTLDCYDDLLIVNGENWPDGLSAAVIDDPILLTRTDSLPEETLAELERLAACNAEEDDQMYVKVIGGTSAVSNAVYGEIAAIATYIDMERLAGANRYETALAVGEAYFEGDCVIMATGENYPDALAAGPMAADQEYPIILNNGDSVRADVGAFLVETGTSCVYIVGGTSVIPQSVEDELAGFYDVYVERIAGDTRAETAVAIAEWLKDDDSVWDYGVTLVNQDGFADALAASDLANDWDYPILMVGANSIPAATAAFHVENCADIDDIVAIGGTSAISDAVLEGAVGAATCAVPAVTSVTMAFSDETAREMYIDWLGDCTVGTNEVMLTADVAGVDANRWAFIFEESPVPADWGVEVLSAEAAIDEFDWPFVIVVTDNFNSLDQTDFVDRFNADPDTDGLFTASGATAGSSFDCTPNGFEPSLVVESIPVVSIPLVVLGDQMPGVATMTLVVTFSVPVESVPFFVIARSSNPNSEEALWTAVQVDEAPVLSEDGLSATYVDTETWFTFPWVGGGSLSLPGYFLGAPRVGVDSAFFPECTMQSANDGECNVEQLVTLSAP